MISKLKIKTNMLKQTLCFTILLFMSMFITSCFVDYGLDTDNYDLVITNYNSSYNFGQVTKFAVIDSVVSYGENGVTHAYDQQIIDKVTSELTALGWQQVTDSTADVTIMLGSTSSTYTVYGTSSWWDYYYWYPGWSYYPMYGSGWSYYYPYYGYGYEYSYTYSTGSLVIAMVDLRLGSNNQLPVQWIAVINGLMNSSNISSRITSTIDQAFAQSPYLKGQ